MPHVSKSNSPLHGRHEGADEDQAQEPQEGEALPEITSVGHLHLPLPARKTGE